MRVSFVRSTKKNTLEKIGGIKVLEQKITESERDIFDDEVLMNKFVKKQDGNLSVSFNLDQMYFESDTSTEQNSKKKLDKSKGQIINEVQVKPYGQEYPIHRTYNQNITMKDSNLESYYQKDQTLNQVIIKEEVNEQKDNLLNISNPFQKSYQDQQIQVDFPQIESNSNDSVQQLSEIDMLFIFPQNISKYDQNHPLLVTVTDLAKIYSLDLKLSHFVQLDSENVQYKHKKIFQAFMIDWRKSQQRLSKKVLTLAKMRTIIIRDAMNNLVDQLVPPIQTQDYHFRISKTYRSRYIKAGIPIPPPRVNNSYLQGLFSQKQIRNYYQNYVEEKLQIFLKDQNYRKIEIFTLDLIQCLRLYQDKSVQELVQILQRKKKPFTNKQIELIIEQARKIGNQYGKDVKRIGNGVRHRKVQQKSQKILQKLNKQPKVKFQNIENRIQEEELYHKNMRSNRNSRKKVKQQKSQKEVKIEVKQEEKIPEEKRREIIYQPVKFHKQIENIFDQQDQVKEE